MLHMSICLHAFIQTCLTYVFELMFNICWKITHDAHMIHLCSIYVCSKQMWNVCGTFYCEHDLETREILHEEQESSSWSTRNINERLQNILGQKCEGSAPCTWLQMADSSSHYFKDIFNECSDLLYNSWGI